MPFPEAERVVYEKNTLEWVKCKIRFPPILMIEAAPPAVFQESIRDDFPQFETRSATIKLPPGIPKPVVQIVGSNLAVANPGNVHAFWSDDRNWSILLNKDGLELSTRAYARWEDFRERMASILASFSGVYRPTAFLHTCVTYKNAVRRKPLEIDHLPWATLLSPWALGPLGQHDSVEVESQQSQFMLRLPGNAGRLEAKLSLGIHQPSNESAFIVEAHCFNDSRKALPDVIPALDVLKRQAGLFFRWCITDELHRAMRPNPLR